LPFFKMRAIDLENRLAEARRKGGDAASAAC